MFKPKKDSTDKQIQKLLRDAGPIYTGTYGRRLWVANMKRLRRLKRVLHPTTFLISLAIALICFIQISKLSVLKADMIVQPAIAETSASITNVHSLSKHENVRMEEEAGDYSFLLTLEKDEPEESLNQDLTMTMNQEHWENGDLLPEKLRYKEVDQIGLKNYLNARKSMLASEPYFSTILNVAREYDVNPLLLFAITGQEQGYVSRDHPHAVQIANNPFNVYHSWTDYNTTIDDSCRITAQTILSLSLDRPEEIDPVLWINRKYASDPNWEKGVNALLRQLEKLAG